MPNKISIVFYKGSKNGYYCIIKEQTPDKFNGQFEHLSENIEKYKAFFVSVENEVIKIVRDDNESVETRSYKTKFIDSTRLIATSL